jgi:hypothetical protein
MHRISTLTAEHRSLCLIANELIAKEDNESHRIYLHHEVTPIIRSDTYFTHTCTIESWDIVVGAV